MSLTDPIGDMLTRIRNGQVARKGSVAVPASKFRVNVLDVLKREGFIKDYATKEVRKGVSEIEVALKYHEGRGAIQNIVRVSTPGRRVYEEAGKLPKVSNGLGISIISTSKGIMSDHEARKARLGGEILCEVF